MLSWKQCCNRYFNYYNRRSDNSRQQICSPLGSVITKQNQADSLLERMGSPYEKTNKVVIDVNTDLSKEYQKLITSYI